jgi:hypothetical protein
MEEERTRMSVKQLKLAGVFLATTLLAGAQVRTVPADTDITVRTNEAIKVNQADTGKTFDGVVNQDVVGQNGNVVIPRGSAATLVVRDLPGDEKALDLESVTVDGNRYMISAEGQSYKQKEGVGKNKRTAKYVGGGALLGTIVGAIAGGGKGAAIGAIAGGAAGAGAQTITRGKEIRVPAESLLTFHLDQPVQLQGARGRGVRTQRYHY